MNHSLPMGGLLQVRDVSGVIVFVNSIIGGLCCIFDLPIGSRDEKTHERQSYTIP